MRIIVSTVPVTIIDSTVDVQRSIIVSTIPATIDFTVDDWMSIVSTVPVTVDTTIDYNLTWKTRVNTALPR